MLKSLQDVGLTLQKRKSLKDQRKKKSEYYHDGANVIFAYLYAFKLFGGRHLGRENIDSFMNGCKATSTNDLTNLL